MAVRLAADAGSGHPATGRLEDNDSESKGMGLSEEQKQQIRDEERRRLEEEEYRAQVRQQLVGGTGAAATAPAKFAVAKVVLLLTGVALTVLAALFAIPKLHERWTGAHLKDTRTSQASTPSPAPEVKLSTAQIAERATASVVTIENSDEDGQRQDQGSGYVASADGTVVTNYHVVRAARSLQVHFPSGGPSFNVDSLLAYDIDNDIAAFQIPGLSVPPLETEVAEQPKVGDRVVAIGAPLGLESTVSEGIISALREVGTAQIIQTTVPVSPGSSGGPLLDEYGKVIGLTTAQMTNAQNLNFGIPARYITGLLAAEHSISLAEMSFETEVVERPAASTVSVPAGKATALTITVGYPQGAVLEDKFSVIGGSGNDVAVLLVAPNGAVVFNSGRVNSSGQFKLRLTRAVYQLVFDNSFSVVSTKSVSQDLKLIHYR